MPKVIYLLGAGASAQCLPVVEDIPARLNMFYQYIVENRVGRPERFKNLTCPETERDGEELLLNACKDLAEKCARHASIDTYAKKLFITASNEYNKLKAVLTCFFLYEQMTHEPDKRYDSFFASILGSHALEFQGDIRILSWNYDYQIEKAYSQYSTKNSIRENQLMLRVHPDGLNIADIESVFSIFKINGTTGFEELTMRSNKNLFPEFNIISGPEMIDKLSWFYLASIRCRDIINSKISFAWETTNPNNIITSACDQIKDASALVVIGYSFPFFNRKFDKQIMQSLVREQRTNIYVQDKDTKPIIDKISSVLPIDHNFDIIPVNSYDQFYLPPEL